jgi:hypothetical protein
MPTPESTEPTSIGSEGQPVRSTDAWSSENSRPSLACLDSQRPNFNFAKRAILNSRIGDAGPILTRSPPHHGVYPVTESFALPPKYRRLTCPPRPHGGVQATLYGWRTSPSASHHVGWRRAIPVGSKRNEKRQIASSLRALVRNEERLTKHTI